MASRIVILYGSSGGNTQSAAQSIAKALGKERCIVRDVARCSPDDLKAFDAFVVGTSTLGLGDIQDDWTPFLRKLAGTDLVGMPFACFGLGDQLTYTDTFVDGMAELHDAFVATGAVPRGSWPAEGYEHEDSKAVREGRFVGLALDAENQYELTSQRIARWVEGLGF